MTSLLLVVSAWLLCALAVLAKSEEGTPLEECFSLIEESRHHAAVRACQKAAGMTGLKDADLGKALLYLAEAQDKTGSPWLAVNAWKQIRDQVEDKDIKNKALEKLAKSQVKFGDFQAARESASKLPEDADSRKAITKSIEDAESLFNQVQKDVASSKWRAVEEKCREMILDHTPYWKDIFDLRINALSSLKEWQRAIDAARSKTRIETDSSETDLLIGKLYLSMGNLVLGRKFIIECAKLNPENKKCMGLRSKFKSFDNLLEEAEKRMLLKDAIVALEEALKSVETVPEDEPFYDKNFPKLFEGFRLPLLKLLCTKHARKKNVAEGMKVCEEAKGMDPSHQDFYLLRLGELHLAKENYEEAIRLLRIASNSNPRDTEIKEMLQKAEKQKTEKMRTKYYDYLGLRKDADDSEIKKAYNKLVRKWHPDKHPTEEGKKIAEERMHNINAAYDVLGDKKKRQMYDQGIDPNDPNSAQGFPGGHPFGGGGHPFGGMHFNMDDLANMFRQGQQGRRGGGGFRMHDDL